MSTIIKVGHASLGEDGKTNGIPGDSGNKEVFINEQYNITSLSPNVVLRPNTTVIADKSVTACIAGCENTHIGYSQKERNTLYTYASAANFDLSTVTTDCNTDCSAFMTVCAIAGGAKITYGSNAPTTTTMRTKFKQSGDYLVLTDAKHLTMTDYLRRGDILVKEGNHTVMVLENGSKYEEATIDDESITQIENIRINKLNIFATNITNTGLTISFNIVENINNEEKIITNTSKWKFKLKLEGLSETKILEKTFTTSVLNLTGLTAGKSYKIQVSAFDSDNEIAFQSAPLIVTTTKTNLVTRVENLGEDTTIGEPFKLVNNIYVKEQDKFKLATIYH
jgi:hypothetical protein